MSGPDATARAALGLQVIRPAFFCWLDVDTDPVYATTWHTNITFTGTGDPELDGFTFSAIDPSFVNISDVREQEGGAESVTATLSGLIGPDNDLLNLLGDRSKWHGRVARLWQMVHNESYAAQGAVWAYYTGRMNSLSIGGDPSSQSITVTIESYLASMSEASNRTYLDQDYYDSGDLSAKAAISIANGLSNTSPAAPVGNAFRRMPPLDTLTGIASRGRIV